MWRATVAATVTNKRASPSAAREPAEKEALSRAIRVEEDSARSQFGRPVAAVHEK